MSKNIEQYVAHNVCALVTQQNKTLMELQKWQRKHCCYICLEMAHKVVSPTYRCLHCCRYMCDDHVSRWIVFACCMCRPDLLRNSPEQPGE